MYAHTTSKLYSATCEGEQYMLMMMGMMMMMGMGRLVIQYSMYPVMIGLISESQSNSHEDR
jgi:hypothetical protein